ncbi:luciferase family protein [Haladaptatus sp. YSMS36]|uniref:luciferase domain-containing protein n=1 Tax=Haladaptatus sp. YSMS36 TaxID=3033384 RepID=UPI0023E84C6D|nr:luciferase family protein [Haladaptatus sp. YSMS36]
MNQIESIISDWPGVMVKSHERGGGREFILDGREIGHVHHGQLVDILFAKRIRDVLIEEGRAQKHHVLPDSGWISYRVRSDQDVDRAVWLLRVSYLYHLLALRKRKEEHPAGDAIEIDVALAELNMSDALEHMFSDLRDMNEW